MDESDAQDRDVLTVEDVIEAGRGRARDGGREVVLPGGMGVALIEELEQELASEGFGQVVAEEVATAGRATANEFIARIDAARERLRTSIDRRDD